MTSTPATETAGNDGACCFLFPALLPVGLAPVWLAPDKARPANRTQRRVVT